MINSGRTSPGAVTGPERRPSTAGMTPRHYWQPVPEISHGGRKERKLTELERLQHRLLYM